MRTLPRFWKALDEIPAATTEVRDWKIRLGNELSLAIRYLRRTGELAEAIDCPSPGDDGCPRGVVRLPSGRLRAVCRSRSGHCDPVELQPGDVAISAVDRAMLVADLRAAFDVTGAIPSHQVGRVVRLGNHAVAAGLSAPVLLLLPGAMDPVSDDEMRDAGLGSKHAIILIPQTTSLPTAWLARLSEAGHLVIDLSSTTGWDASGHLAVVQSVDVLLHPIRWELLARVGGSSRDPQIILPPGTEWGQIMLTFTAAETLICTVAGQGRQMDPGDFGMRSAKNNHPTVAWGLLRQLVAARGVLVIGGAPLHARVRKQKQELTARLIQTLGITSDPLPWNKDQHAYVARFIARDERPKVEREQRYGR